jgi:hypothetical protein
MLRWFRRSGRLTAPFAMVIAAMVVVGTVDWWHADDQEGASLAFHDHGAHHPVFAPARLAARAPDHCYLCHWLRTLGNGLGSVAQYRLAPNKGRQVLHVAACRTSDLVAAILPARAPPASLHTETL